MGRPSSSAAAPATDVVIPYTKFTLDNGLTVIVHEDRSDPLIHVAEAMGLRVDW